MPAQIFLRSGRSCQRLGKAFKEPSRTKSEFAEDCDINVILERFTKTGVLEHQARFQGMYGNFIGLPQSLQDARNQVRDAEEMFMTLPARIRERFQNSPELFLEAVDQAADNPALRDELRALGVFKPATRASEKPAEGVTPKAPTEGKEESAKKSSEKSDT